MTELEFDNPPSILKAYGELARNARKRKGPVDELPELAATLPSVQLAPSHVRAFRRVCSIPDTSPDIVPLMYPHVLAAALHAQLLAHRDFPFSGAGLIHVRNTIRTHRPLRIAQSLDLRVWLGGLADAPKGQEFDLLTEARVDGELVWEETTTILSPQRAKSASRTPNKEREAFVDTTALSHNVILPVPEGQGRAYARVSRDFNPIHLHLVTAKLFGFRRAIVHGMWTVGRALGELHDAIPATSCELEVRFKRPLFLPSSILLRAQPVGEDALRFDVTNPSSGIPHLEATLSK